MPYTLQIIYQAVRATTVRDRPTSRGYRHSSPGRPLRPPAQPVCRVPTTNNVYIFDAPRLCGLPPFATVRPRAAIATARPAARSARPPSLSIAYRALCFLPVYCVNVV